VGQTGLSAVCSFSSAYPTSARSAFMPRRVFVRGRSPPRSARKAEPITTSTFEHQAAGPERGHHAGLQNGRLLLARLGTCDPRVAVMQGNQCATLSHMEIGVRDLRNRTTQVVDAVRAGNRVTLTVRGEPVADIVPHGQRVRWLSGAQVREQLERRAADSALTGELEAIAGQTLDEL
jgi:prevent-host-death family protein